jgi:hypothetical protein
MSSIAKLSSIEKLCIYGFRCTKGAECKFYHNNDICTFCINNSCKKVNCSGKAVQVVDVSKGIYSFGNIQFVYFAPSVKKDEKKQVEAVKPTKQVSLKKKFVKKVRQSDKFISEFGEASFDFGTNGKIEKLTKLFKKLTKAKLGLEKELKAVSDLHELVRAKLPRRDAVTQLSQIDLGGDSSSSDEETED